MLSEGRKRDAAANAVLALSFAANAAQSPQSFVTSGKTAAPSLPLMGELMRKRKEANRNLDSSRVSEPARNRKKKTFKEFVEETYEYIEEGSSGERGRRRLSPRGPSSDKWERNKQRSVSSSNAALKKAGFSRSTKYMSGTKGRPTKWTETSTSSHHGTETGTYANQSDYASRKVPKRGATSTRVSKLKKIRTQLGGDRTSRPVHDVEVTKKRTYNDTPSSTMTRGRSFRKEVTKGVSDNLKKAGAKPGDIMTATPTSSSRSRMYGRTHNVRTDRKTGILVDRIREELKLIREGAHFSSKDELMKHHGGKLPDGTFIKNRGTKENPKYGLASIQSRENEKERREKRIKQATGQLTPREKAKVERKRRLAKRRGAELHHGTEIETSGKEMKNMSPGDVLRYKKKQAQQNRYHGNDPRNLVVANKSPVSKFKPQQPGFHHGKFHAFERGNREKLSDISNAITPMRAYTTLVNKARRKTRRGED